MPVLSVKWIDDPTAFVELDAYFKTLMQQSGTSELLVQTFVSAAESHSYVSDATYVTLLSALSQWVVKGTKPTAASISEACPSAAVAYPAGVGCKFNPAYVAPALESRMPARERP